MRACVGAGSSDYRGVGVDNGEVKKIKKINYKPGIITDMKHLEKTDYIIHEINKVIKIIEPLYTVNEYTPFMPDKFIERLRSALLTLDLLDLEDVRLEFWDICENLDRINDLKRVYKVRFRKLLEWHNGYDNGKSIKVEVREYVKKHEIFDDYSEVQISDIERLYLKIIIAIKGLKANVLELFKQWEEMSPGYDENKQISIYNGNFKIAKSKKTDFIKILSAMYDARMFETPNGFIASNKQTLFDEFGKILDENFSNYSTLLSKSKGTDETSFLKPFKELEKKATDYFNYEKEN